MKIEFMHVIEKRQTAMFYHVDDSLLADVCIMTNYFCLCEWWFSAAVCSYKTAFCPKPSSFSMSDCAAAVSSHGSQRQRRGAPFPRQTCQCPPEWGVPLQGGTLSSPHNARRPNKGTEFGSEDVKQTCSKWHFYLLAVTSPPPATFIYWDPQCHFQQPHGNSRTCQQGYNFLMMSPCREWFAAPRKLMKLLELIFSCKHKTTQALDL